jgi:hypothetical protein
MLYVLFTTSGDHDADKRRMLQQLVLLDASYHGGLSTYINNARKLLEDSRTGKYHRCLPVSSINTYCHPEAGLAGHAAPL